MEDAHIIEGIPEGLWKSPPDAARDSKPPGVDGHVIFAVFDGHGGDFVARCHVSGKTLVL